MSMLQTTKTGTRCAGTHPLSGPLRSSGARNTSTAAARSPVGPAPTRLDVPDVEAAPCPRRLALAALAGLALLPSMGGSARAATYQTELCSMRDTMEDAEACRRNEIEKDAAKKEDYVSASDRKFGTVSGVPVSVLDSEYVRASTELMEELELYCTLDPYDKQRVALTKKLKADSLAWVSKYARGGSARSLSARRLYIAVDGVIGFLASNGLAPYPKQKVKLTLTTVEQARAFLAENK